MQLIQIASLIGSTKPSLLTGSGMLQEHSVKFAKYACQLYFATE